MNVLIISTRKHFWQTIAPYFQAKEFTLDFTDTLDKALDRLREVPPIVIILDSEPCTTKEEYILRIRDDLTAILKINAMVHTAVVSSLSNDEFHNCMEGFGVLLNIPLKASQHDVERLAEALEKCQC